MNKQWHVSAPRYSRGQFDKCFITVIYMLSLLYGSLVLNLLFHLICSHVAAKKQEEPFNSL